MNAILEFFCEETDRTKESFKAGPAIMMGVLFLIFIAASIYVLINSI